MERVMLHLLKIRYLPGKHTPGWDLSIWNAQKRIQVILEDSPSLRAGLEDHMRHPWRFARSGAIQQTGLADDVFPVECPFTVEAVVGSLE